MIAAPYERFPVGNAHGPASGPALDGKFDQLQQQRGGNLNDYNTEE